MKIVEVRSIALAAVAGVACVLAVESVGGNLRPTQIPQDRLTLLNSKGELGWKIRHENILSTIWASGGKMDFVLIGDSITCNWGETEAASYFGGTRKFGKAVADAKFAGYRWLNLGFGGDGTSQVLWRLLNGELDGYETKLVALMIGTNNKNDSAEDVALGIQTLVETIREKQPKAKILLNAILPRFPREDDPGYEQNHQAMNDKNFATNELIKKLCDGETVVWFDWNSQLYKGGELDSDLYYDREHLDDAGYTIWADNLLPYIREAAGSGSGKTPVISGTGFHLKDGASDWTAPASYYENEAPGAGDVVIVPSSVTVHLNASTDAASLTLVNSLKNIFLTGDDSRLEISVGGTDVREVTRSITAYGFDGKTVSGAQDYTGGPIVKTGTGTLILSSQGERSPGDAYNRDYYSQILVAEGTLKLTPSLTSPCNASSLGRIRVEEGATLFLPGCSWKNSAVYLYGLSGAGVVTNELFGGYVTDLNFNAKLANGDWSDFSGQLNGKYNALYFNCDAQTLSGLDSRAVSGSIQSMDNSHIRLASLGISSTSPSALGYGKPTYWVSDAGATIEFVGNGGVTCEQALALRSVADSTVPRDVVVDAGRKGGLTFSGLWQRVYSSPGGKSLVLDGDNSDPCVFTGLLYDNFDSSDAGGRGHTLYVSKEGTGTWRFDKTARSQFTCGWSVNEGVLEYETIAPKGFACSLGSSMNLTDGQCGATDFDPAHRVDYAFRLGAPTLDGEAKTSGRLSYVGAAAAVNIDRRVALAGAGGFRSDATSGGIVHGDVYGISSQAMSLYLDGDNAGDGNVVGKVSDGTAGGKVTVVKEGTGKWTVGALSDFTGGIDVRGGELVLDAPRYSWYRWNITALYPVNATKPYSTWVDGKATKEVMFYEFSLYDKDGNNQVEHYQTSTTVKKASDVPLLEPGTAQIFTYGDNRLESVAQTVTYEGVTSNYFMDVWKAFDLATTKGYGVWGVKYKLYDKGNAQIRIGDNADARVSMVLRVKPGVNDIVGYDYINTYGGWNQDWNTAVRDASLEASVDGIHWDTLHTATDAPVHYDGGMWTYQGGYSSGEEKHTGSYSKAFQLENPHDIARCPQIAAKPAFSGSFPVDSVKLSGGGRLTVAAGADALKVSTLEIDATTGGTLDGVTLKDGLVINFVNLPKERDLTVPVSFVNVKGLENSSGWSFTFDGKVSSRWSVSVGPDGKIRLSKSGLAIIVR